MPDDTDETDDATPDDTAPTDESDELDADDPDPPPHSVADHVHEAPDGTDLALRVFRPEGVDADDPAPVLLQRTPYGRPEDFAERSLAPMALEAGYAVAYEDTRGRGDSGGEFLPWVHEAADGAATVEWLADRPWSTGRVGTFGGSSPGQVQLLLAAEDPAGLAAIAPMFSPADLHRSDFFQDGALSALTFLTWSLDQSVAGHTVDRLEDAGRLAPDAAAAAREALDDALERVDELAAHRPLAEVPEHVLSSVDLPDGIGPGDVVPHWDAWLSRPAYDDFWRSFDPEVGYDRVTVPGLHVTGWYELCQNGTLTSYAGLRDRSPAPQHLVVGPWAHQDTSGELADLDYGPGASADDYGVWETHLAFFDTYVRGEPTGPFAGGGGDGPSRAGGRPSRAAGDGPDRLVETYRTTVADGDGGGEWCAHDDWPPAGVRTERWFLGSDGAATGSTVATAGDATSTGGTLSRSPPARFEPADRWTHDPDDPVPTRGGPLCCGEAAPRAGPRDQRPVADRDDVATYATAALPEPLTLAGPVVADLVVSTTAADGDVVARLVHVTDEGLAYNICEGVQRLRFRRGRDRPVPVPEGEPVRARVDMWDIHHRVPAGDRLQLAVAASSHPRFDPHPGTADPWRATEDDVETAEVALYHERDRESTLEVTCLE